jgi:hypothetical protein
MSVVSTIHHYIVSLRSISILSSYLYRVSQNDPFSRNLFDLAYSVAEKINLDNSSSHLSSEIARIVS